MLGLPEFEQRKKKRNGVEVGDASLLTGESRDNNLVPHMQYPSFPSTIFPPPFGVPQQPAGSAYLHSASLPPDFRQLAMDPVGVGIPSYHDMQQLPLHAFSSYIPLYQVGAAHRQHLEQLQQAQLRGQDLRFLSQQGELHTLQRRRRRSSDYEKKTKEGQIDVSSFLNDGSKSEDEENIEEVMRSPDVLNSLDEELQPLTQPITASPGMASPRALSPGASSLRASSLRGSLPRASSSRASSSRASSSRYSSSRTPSSRASSSKASSSRASSSRASSSRALSSRASSSRASPSRASPAVSSSPRASSSRASSSRASSSRSSSKTSPSTTSSRTPSPRSETVFTTTSSSRSEIEEKKTRRRYIPAKFQKNIEEWSPQDVASWICSIGESKNYTIFARKFLDANVEGRVLAALSLVDFQEVTGSSLHANVIWNRLEEVKHRRRLTSNGISNTLTKNLDSLRIIRDPVPTTTEMSPNGSAASSPTSLQSLKSSPVQSPRGLQAQSSSSQSSSRSLLLTKSPLSQLIKSEDRSETKLKLRKLKAESHVSLSIGDNHSSVTLKLTLPSAQGLHGSANDDPSAEAGQACVRCYDAKRKCSHVIRESRGPCDRCLRRGTDCVPRTRKRMGRPPTFQKDALATFKQLKTSFDLDGMRGLSQQRCGPGNYLIHNMDMNAAKRYQKIRQLTWQEKFTPDFVDELKADSLHSLRDCAIEAAMMGNLGMGESNELLCQIGALFPPGPRPHPPKMTYQIRSVCAMSLITDLNDTTVQNHPTPTNWPVACQAWEFSYEIDEKTRVPTSCHAIVYVNKAYQTLFDLNPEELLFALENDPVPMLGRYMDENDWVVSTRAQINVFFFARKQSVLQKLAHILRIRSNHGRVTVCCLNVAVHHNEYGLMDRMSMCMMPIPGQGQDVVCIGDNCNDNDDINDDGSDEHNDEDSGEDNDEDSGEDNDEDSVGDERQSDPRNAKRHKPNRTDTQMKETDFDEHAREYCGSRTDDNQQMFHEGVNENVVDLTS